MAESVGFEPTRPCGLPDFERIDEYPDGQILLYLDEI